MVVARDFLNEAPHVNVDYDPLRDVNKTLVSQGSLLTSILNELRKDHPEVLAYAQSQFNNQILAGDTGDKRVFFEIGGKPVTIHKLMVFSTYDGDCYFSVQDMGGNAKNGIHITAGFNQVFLIDVDSVHIKSDGAQALYINQSNSTHGGLFLYGFTIPDFDLVKG